MSQSSVIPTLDKMTELKNLSLVRGIRCAMLNKRNRRAGSVQVTVPKGLFVPTYWHDGTASFEGQEEDGFWTEIHPMITELKQETQVRIHLPEGYGRLWWFRYQKNSYVPKNISVTQMFDQIYVINLDSQPERYRRLKKLLAKFHLPHQRFSAIPGEELNTSDLEDTQLPNKNAYGCLLSHLKILQDAKRAQYRRILILEDDVWIHPDLLEKMNYYHQALPDWELLYLGGTQHMDTWHRLKYFPGYYQASQTNGSFAYGVDNKIFDDLIHLLVTKQKPVDALLREYQKKSSQAWVTYPNLMIADVSESSIRSSRSQEKYSQQMGWSVGEYLKS